MPSLVESKQDVSVQLDNFDVTKADPEKIIDSLRRNGGCFVRNYVSKADLAQMVADVTPHIEADVPWEGDFFPKETRRVMGLPGKSPTYMTKVLGSPLFTAVSDGILTTKSQSWVGGEKQFYKASPQINSATVLSIGPGAKAQGLHRDDTLHHNQYPALDSADQWTPERETSVGIFIAGTRTNKANGATRFIPQSHLEASTDGPGDERKTVYAELEPGDAFLMLASCFHGGSANTTTDETRVVFAGFMTRGHLRQEENQFLANPIEKVKLLPADIQKMIGYSVSEPFCGWVDLKDPFQLLYLKEGETMAYRDLGKSE